MKATPQRQASWPPAHAEMVDLDATDDLGSQ
jgi:hypothetical protein